MANDSHTVGLVMIVRNEARGLARCLESVRPWVDDLLVMDTGSTDDSVAIAHQHGARVGHFEWVNDFSVARNAALALSPCDWRLVLDGDEWLVAGGQALHALKSQAPTFVGRVAVNSVFDQSGAQATSSLPRVLPRGCRYEGRIHEQPVFDGPRHTLAAVQVAHDGYLPAQMQAKGDRNRRLLTLAVQEHPTDPYLHYQLGKDHEVHDRFALALPSYARALDLLGPLAARQPSWRHDLILRHLYTLKAEGRVADAVDLAQSEMPHWPDSPDFYFVLGDVLLEHAVTHPEQAGEVLPMIRAAWEQCLLIGENPTLEGAVQGRGSHLARQQLALLDQVMGSLSDVLPSSR